MNWLDSTAAVAIAAPKKKRTLLPLLTVVFLLSYALMTLLIVEQGAAIQSQSNLIKVLMPESRELWGMKGKAIADKAAKERAQTRTEASTRQAPTAQTPTVHGPAAQAQANATPQRGSQARAHADKATKPQVQFPPIPASDLDPRRTVRTI
ncbi:MAG TPA: hypothetical protein VMF10_06355 [Candidatus Aquilonibacter sp.]|nr:hypothetical protein [Candidatus Aquilonibacter sp.]